jgi:DeoR family transcriptional regulator, suf operon transcriptional repressor
LRGVWRSPPPLFPTNYAELTAELLDHVEAEDPALLERAFERRRQTRVAQARARLDGLGTVAPRARELAAILYEAGYLAEARPLEDGGYRIAEHNCAILAVAATTITPAPASWASSPRSCPRRRCAASRTS